MKKNFHLQLFVLAVVFLQASVLFAQELVHAAPESAGCSAERLARLTATLENYVNQEKLPGTVTLIARGGKIIYFDATGSRDIERGIPMEKNSIFRIASQTKALVSVGVMMLQEEGKLLISDPVGKYIAAFNTTTVAVPGEDGSYTIEDANRPITIRDLLTHTSGIGYGQGIAADLWEKPASRAGILPTGRNRSLKRSPGWRHCPLMHSREINLYMATTRTSWVPLLKLFPVNPWMNF